MNWEAIGAIGQLVGSVAVLVTLGYLANQVRHARGELRRSISQGRAETARRLSLNRANNERLAAVHWKANKALEPQSTVTAFGAALIERAGLTREEAWALFFDENAWWSYRAQVVPYIAELSSGERSEFEHVIRAQYGGMPVSRLWFESMKDVLDPDAVRYVDGLLAQRG